MTDSTTPVILSACRTPIGRYLGGLSPVPGPKLGALVIREAMRRAAVPDDVVDEFIMGNVLQGGEAHAPAPRVPAAGSTKSSWARCFRAGKAGRRRGRRRFMRGPRARSLP